MKGSGISENRCNICLKTHGGQALRIFRSLSIVDILFEGILEHSFNCFCSNFHDSCCNIMVEVFLSHYYNLNLNNNILLKNLQKMKINIQNPTNRPTKGPEKDDSRKEHNSEENSYKSERRPELVPNIVSRLRESTKPAQKRRASKWNQKWKQKWNRADNERIDDH